MSNPVNVCKESIPAPLITDSSIVGTEEFTLVPHTRYPKKSLIITADPGNTDDLYFGTPGNAVNGFRLGPGESSPPLYVDSTERVGIVAASGEQNYKVFGQ